MPYKDGKGWRGVIKVHGKRIGQKTFQLKRDAAAWEKEQKERLKKGLALQGKLDLLTICSQYLIHSKPRYVVKTYKEKKAVIELFLTFIGPDTLVANVTANDIQTYLDIQLEARSANASNKDRKNLLAMWNYGMKFHGIEFNPVAVTYKFPHDPEPQYTPPTEDVLKVLGLVERQDRVMLDCYVNTAARRSEVFRWKWADDIDFERQQIRLGTRKTKDSSMRYDWLPMSEKLHESLKWLWDNREIKGNPYVFPNLRKGPYYGQPFQDRRKFMTTLCKKAEVKPFQFHALRRYVGSMLADYAIPAKRIQQVLRHRNLATTERYIKSINHDLKDPMDLITCGSVPQ